MPDEQMRDGANIYCALAPAFYDRYTTGHIHIYTESALSVSLCNHYIILYRPYTLYYYKVAMIVYNIYNIRIYI